MNSIGFDKPSQRQTVAHGRQVIHYLDVESIRKSCVSRREVCIGRSDFRVVAVSI